jgi:uncharacterized membrane protein YjgN (DUF898 family)
MKKKHFSPKNMIIKFVVLLIVAYSIYFTTQPFLGYFIAVMLGIVIAFIISGIIEYYQKK